MKDLFFKYFFFLEFFGVYLFVFFKYFSLLVSLVSILILFLFWKFLYIKNGLKLLFIDFFSIDLINIFIYLVIFTVEILVDI